MTNKSKKKSAIDIVLEHSRKHYWDDIVEQLNRGKTPRKDHIIHGLRSGNPVPEIVNEFIADVMEGNSKFKRGAEKNIYLGLKYALCCASVRFKTQAVDRWEKRYKRKMPDRRNAIYERVADSLNLSISTVEKAVALERKKRRN